MSAHLRHCKKHSRPGKPMPLPCKHCAMIQKPAVPVIAIAPIETAPPAQPITAEPIPVLSVQPVTKKRGRPPKGDRAMTPAERKRLQRHTTDAKEKDIERRNLIAKILRKLRVGKSIPDEKNLSASSLAEKAATDATGLNAMIANLKTMSIADLQNTYDSLKYFSDSKGRLANERSGEKDRRDGQSQIEGIIGITEYAPAQATNPEGHAPDTYEKPNPSLDKADSRKLTIDLPSDPNEYEKLKAEVMQQMVTDKTKCQVCGLVCETTEKLSQHLSERYETGVKQLNWLAQLEEFSYGMEAQIADTKTKIRENQHPYAVHVLMSRLEKEKKKEGRLARRLERKGKQAANQFKTEERERKVLQAEIENWGTKDKTKSPGERRVDADPPAYPRFNRIS